MRKRYQTIHKREQTAHERETRAKKEAEKKEYFAQEKDRYEPYKKKIDIDLSSKDIPPHMEKILRLLLARRQRKQKQPSLIGVLMIMALLGIFAGIALNGGESRVGSDIIDSVGALFTVAVALIPVVMIVSVLQRFLPMKVAVSIGAWIVLAMIFMFVSYVVSHWGGGY